MSWNNNYTTGNLLQNLHHQKCYKLIGIDLSRQANTSIPQQINFVGKLEESDSGKMFFVWKASNQSNANYDAGNEIFYNTV